MACSMLVLWACPPPTAAGPQVAPAAAPAPTVPLPEGETDDPPEDARTPAAATVAGPEMITIPAGPFTRGAVGGKPDELPVRTIVLAAFDIDRTEVAVEAYQACVAKGGCTPAGTGPGCNGGRADRGRHPINCITWAQADVYCRAAGKRLPTEAEWEKAARSADTRVYTWGNTWPPPRGGGNFADTSAQRLRPYWLAIERYDDGAANTQPVDARVIATAQGGLHFLGNVAEWVADWYEPKAYESGPESDPPGPKRGRARVVRGGSFGQALAEDLRATRRMYYDPLRASLHFGVRCAK